MGKKHLCLILAAVLAASSLAVSASAAAIDSEPSSDSKGTFFFDSGDWNSENINFYIWDSTTGEYATGNKGWVSENPWGSRKRLGGTAVEGKTGVFESYELDLSGRENDAVYVIFHDADSGAQTFDTLINSSVFGYTATKDGIIYENPTDSDKTAVGVHFDGGDGGVGVAKVITSTGRIQGDIIHPSVDCADVVATYVLTYLHNEVYKVTEQSVADAIAAFGTTADDVWAKYLSHKGDENYPDYDEEAAKKLIKPSESSSDQPATSSSLLGDVDKSNKIDSADALSILRASVKLETFDDATFKLADVDSDGKLSSGDSLQVLRYSVHLDTPYAIGQPVK